MLAIALPAPSEAQQPDRDEQRLRYQADIARLLADTSGSAQVSLHSATGAARFVRLPRGSQPRGLGRGRSEAAAFARSLEFLGRYGQAFGIRDPATELERSSAVTDALRQGRHITYRQLYRGLPVFGAELKSHFDAAGELVAVNGTFVPGIDVDPNPARSAEEAERTAVARVEADLGRGGPLAARGSQLLVFRAGLAKGVPGRSHLAWRVEVGDGAGVREFVFIDAHTGKLVDQVSGTPDGLFRRAYDGQHLPGVPDSYPASPFWSEGDAFPTGTTEADNMILSSKEAYDLYSNAFGRDSFDGAGAVLDAIFNRGYSCPNASWNGAFISFCPGLTTDDVTGHEWSHAYTEYTDNLIYQWQPGALNEASSDIFGETIDRINGRGGDTPDNPRTAGGCSVFTPNVSGTDNSVRWLLGEDDTAPGLSGALRDMWNPNCYGGPGKVSDGQYWCSAGDGGGVHTNSGVDNHAYALLVDGGSYNGQTVAGIGLTKAAHVYFRAKLLYQGPATDFAEHADALEQACADLVGVELNSLTTGLPSGETVSVGDCSQLANALLAVQMRTPPSQCNFQPLLAPNPPDRCSPGATQVDVYFDDFENPPVGWTATHAASVPADFTPRDWAWSGSLPGNRPGSAFFGIDFPGGTCGPGGDESGVLHLDSPSIPIPAGVTSPRLTFDHWVSTEGGWDGGNLRISVNGGAWTLVSPAAYTFNSYNATLYTGPQGNSNPLAGQTAFSGADGGSVLGSWGRSHVDLSAYAGAGDSVRLRFDVGNDGCFGTFGWYVDDVLLYSCAATPPPTLSINDVSLAEGNSGTVNASFTVTLSAASLQTVTVNYASADGTAVAPGDYTAIIPGTLTFAPGVTTLPLTVAVNGDTQYEADETFFVNLGNPTHATLADGQGQGTIRNDDPQPMLSIDDVSVTEGNSGTVNAVFSVTQSVWVPTATVQYATADGSATATADYSPASGMLSFASGPTQTITVAVKGDTLDEQNEAFLVSLSAPADIVIGKGVGQGTILDNDGRAALCKPIGYAPFTIASSDSYCVVKNIAYSSASGAAITIETDDVLIDMKGFTLEGMAGTGTQAYGIYALNRSGLSVRNGSVVGFRRGVYLKDDSGTGAKSSGNLVRSLKVLQNTEAGIWVGGSRTTIQGNAVIDTGGAMAGDVPAYGIVLEGAGQRVMNNDVIDLAPTGAGAAYGIRLTSASRSFVEKNRVGNTAAAVGTGLSLGGSDLMAVQNRLSSLGSGIVFVGAATGKYRGNLASGCSTPYTGGTDAGNN